MTTLIRAVKIWIKAGNDSYRWLVPKELTFDNIITMVKRAKGSDGNFQVKDLNTGDVLVGTETLKQNFNMTKNENDFELEIVPV